MKKSELKRLISEIISEVVPMRAERSTSFSDLNAHITKRDCAVFIETIYGNYIRVHDGFQKNPHTGEVTVLAPNGKTYRYISDEDESENSQTDFHTVFVAKAVSINDEKFIKSTFHHEKDRVYRNDMARSRYADKRED